MTCADTILYASCTYYTYDNIQVVRRGAPAPLIYTLSNYGAVKATYQLKATIANSIKNNQKKIA